MDKKFYEIIKFPSYENKTGKMYQYETGSAEDRLPFIVKKTLVIKGMKGADQRGGHTHHKTTQVLIALSGGCSVSLDNGTEKCTLALNNPNEGLLLKPYVWHTMQDFKPDTILLVLADTEYDESEYIRNYEDFLQQLQKAVRK